MDWKLKFCLRNSISGSFGDQNVAPGLVKNDKNIFFLIPDTSPPTPFYLKKKFLRAIVS